MPLTALLSMLYIFFCHISDWGDIFDMFKLSSRYFCIVIQNVKIMIFIMYVCTSQNGVEVWASNQRSKDYRFEACAGPVLWGLETLAKTFARLRPRTLDLQVTMYEENSTAEQLKREPPTTATHGLVLSNLCPWHWHRGFKLNKEPRKLLCRVI